MRDYLCKDCPNNNNGWCTVKKCQGLKSITECEHKDIRKSTDLIDTVKELLNQKAKNEFEEHHTLLMARALIESKYEYHKWINEIPYLKFREYWDVKIIPPTSGAIVRFFVSNSCTGKDVSVYLDCYGELAVMNEPYWEIYPDADGNNSRYFIEDSKELMEAISDAID